MPYVSKKDAVLSEDEDKDELESCCEVQCSLVKDTDCGSTQCSSAKTFNYISLFFFFIRLNASTTISSTGGTMKVNRADSEKTATKIEDCCEETFTCEDHSCDGTKKLVKRPDDDTRSVRTFRMNLEDECCTTGVTCVEKDTLETCKKINHVPLKSLPAERFLDSEFNERCCEPLTCSRLAEDEPTLCGKPYTYKGLKEGDEPDNKVVCNFNISRSLFYHSLTHFSQLRWNILTKKIVHAAMLIVMKSRMSVRVFLTIEINP